jgi:ParB family chromosome partitioning protein
MKSVSLPSKLNGLDILFGESTDTLAPTLTLPPTQILIPQWRLRRYFDKEKLLSLGQSLHKRGFGQPLAVRLVKERYELVVGERRLRAALLLEMHEVPVFVVENLSDSAAIELSLAENLYKESLNPYEETSAILQLLALRLNCDTSDTLTILKRMKRHHDAATIKTDDVVPIPEAPIVHEFFSEWDAMTWESFVKNRLPIFNLPPEILTVLQEGRLEYTKAKLIATIKDEAERSRFLDDAIAQNLSVREIRETLPTRRTEQPEWKRRVEKTSSLLRSERIQVVWEDSRKRKRLERLLGEIELLLQEEASSELE